MKDIKQIDKSQELERPEEPDPLLTSPNHQKVLRALLLQRLAAALGILSLGVLYLFLSDKLVPAFIPKWLPLLLDGILVQESCAVVFHSD